MKPTQWVGAVFLLAAMVFVVTFAMNYLGNADRPSSPTPTATGEGLQLTFAETEYPGKEEAPTECEVQKPSYHDFWFRNENERSLDVGVYHKSCRCAGVDLFVLPADGRRQMAVGVVSRLALAPAGLCSLALLGTAGQPLPDLEKRAQVASLDQLEKATVPAGAAGWVRLRWAANGVGSQVLSAQMWSDRKDTGPSATLQVQARSYEPLRVPPGGELAMGLMKAEDLPHTDYLLCWSSTRLDFSVQARVDSTRAGTADAFEVGTPEPLNAQDRARLAKSAGEGPVLSGYRIPVTVRPVSRDGTTPFDLGQFRRDVELSSDDDGINPLRVSVTGTVEGDVSVENEEGGVRFGLFNRSRGARQSVSLGSDVPGLELEVDRKRTPDYLDARLDAPRTASSGHRSWRLNVRVLPDRVSGTFPRRDDPAYRDCAVYLKTGEKPPRSVRIPVTGTATDG